MRFSNVMPALALVLLLPACGSSKEDNQVTETRMDNLDSLEGTISDDMINTDEAVDEVPTHPAQDGSEPAKSDDATPKGAAPARDTAKIEKSSEPK